MPDTLRLRLPEINRALLEKLADKYGSAEVELSIQPGSAAPGERLSEADFWQLIGLLDWGRERSRDILAPAVEALSRRPVADIRRFDDLLAEKLHALDGEQFAGPGDESDDHFSVDGFLYDRCGAVANGPIFYQKVLKKPSIFPKNSGFEPLLNLAAEAHALRTGLDEYDHLPDVSYETFSNAAGWPGRPSLQKLILAG